MRASTKRIASFLLSLGFLVGSFVVYGALLKPEYEAVNVLRGELASKDEFLREQEQVVTEVQDLIARYQGARGLGETISLALPREEETASFLHQLTAIARNANLSIQSVGFSAAPLRVSGAASGAPAARVKVATIVASVDAVGTYEALKVFLRALETNIRVMDVAELKADPKDPRAIAYRIKVEAYHQTQ